VRLSSSSKKKHDALVLLRLHREMHMALSLLPRDKKTSLRLSSSSKNTHDALDVTQRVPEPLPQSFKHLVECHPVLSLQEPAAPLLICVRAPCPV